MSKKKTDLEKGNSDFIIQLYNYFTNSSDFKIKIYLST